MRGRYLIFLLLLCFSFSFSQKQENYSYSGNTTGFIENKGQISDEKGRPVPQVLYMTSTANADIYLTNSGITYIFKKAEAENEKEEEEQKIEWCRLEMKISGAVIGKPNVTANDETNQGSFNYYFPHCPKGITNVLSYKTIVFNSVYPGIDWLIKISDKGITYDFIVHPGADPSVIKLQYSGHENLKVSDHEIQIKTRYAKIQEGALFCFEKESNNRVDANYLLNRSVVTFSISGYDKTKTLVIDPPIQLLNWATYYGGANRDGPRSICTDAAGNTFITGYCGSDPFPLQNAAGSYNQGTLAASFSAFILKFDNAGARQWATYFGGSSREAGLGIKRDASGNLFVGGWTQSGDLPITDPGGGAFMQLSNNGGNSELFISKFSPAGALTWCTYYGGALDENTRSIDVDAAGNLFITGYTNSTDFPVQNSGTYFQGSYSGGTSSLAGDAFILKFNNAGVRQWATYFGGNADDAAYCIKVGASGNVYLSGATESNNFPTLNQGAGSYFQGTIGGAKDAFIVKFDNNGTLKWSTYYGGSLDDGDFHMAPSYDRTDGCITTDLSENLYFTGYTRSSDFPLQNQGGSAYYQATAAGPAPFIVKFRPSGARVWSTYYGDNGQGGALVTDQQGNLYVGGSTMSASFPTLSPGCGAFLKSGYSGGIANGDIFIAQFDSVGTHFWGTYFGGPADEWVDGLSVSPTGCVYLTGEWLSASGINTLNPGGGAYFQPVLGGAQGPCDNGFILRFCPAPLTSTTSQTSLVCANDSNAVASVSVCGGSPPYTYTWSTNPAKFTQTVTNLPAGNYVVIIKDGSGNTFTTSVSIIAPGAVSVSALSSTTIASGETTTLSAIGNVVSYTWMPPAGLSATNISNPSASPTITTVYTVVATTSNNCRASDMVTITVTEPVEVCGDIFVPTGFTPNGDGANDLECVMGHCITELHFEIYDRWGEKVFETTDQSKCWDGFKQGKLMDSGVFVYHLRATLKNGEQINKKGNLHLFR